MTAARTDHDDLREEAALYVLGALDLAEGNAFEAHLTSCAECAAEVRALRPTVAALADAVPQIDAPPVLRQRVLSSVGARQPSSPLLSRSRAIPTRLPWLAAAASLIAAVGLGSYTVQLRGELESLGLERREARARAEATDREIASARRIALEAQTTVRVISAPDLQRSDLVGQGVAPQASARAFWSRSRGLVFTASNLPELPAGRTYQLWIVTSQAAVSAGIFRPDADGRAESVLETPPDLPKPVAMAVTIEPAGGVPAPTGDKYLVGSVSGL